MKSMRILLLALLSIGVSGPVAAWVNESEQPGSVLVFPKFIRGTFNDARVSGQLFHARTEIEISVQCPANSICSNDAVFLKANWVCPGCSEASFNLNTTIGGTLYFNPEGVVSVLGVATANAFPSNATTTIPVPPCDRGYLIVWAVDSFGRAIKQDGLIGDAVLRDAPGIENDLTARGYNAIAIQAGDGVQNTLDLTDLNGNGALDFNGSEYQMVSGNIVGTVRYENSVLPEGNVETDLTLLTLDVVTNRSNPVTSVGLNFYTPDEGVIDAGTALLCWREQRLPNLNPSLTKQAMGRKGLVESTFATQVNSSGATVPVTLLGLVETKEFVSIVGVGQVQVRDYAYSLSHRPDPVTTTYVPDTSSGAS